MSALDQPDAAAPGPDSRAESAGPSTALLTVIAVATGALAANLYYAQPLIAWIGPELKIPPALAGALVSVTQIGYGVGLFLLVSAADLIENKRLVLSAVLILAGNVSLGQIVTQQAGFGLHWNVINCTIAFFVFMVAAFAETNRVPFDLPEAESELIAGYHSEYSAMKFSMFFIAEYSNMITASALMTTLFFGGWSVPFWTTVNVAPWAWWKTLITLVAFTIKVVFFLFLFMWVRWTLPRFRYDQLMGLGWKFMLPVALGYIVIMSGALLVLQAVGIAPDARWLGFVPVYWAILGILNLVLAALVFVILDRGRIVSPAYSRIEAVQIARLRARSVRSALTPVEGD